MEIAHSVPSNIDVQKSMPVFDSFTVIIIDLATVVAVVFVFTKKANKNSKKL